MVVKLTSRVQRWFFLMMLNLLPFFPFSQIADSVKPATKLTVAGFSVGVHYGSVFAHSQEVQNTAGANPKGLEFAYTWQQRDKNAIDLCNCYPRQGIVASYIDYDNEILGRGIMAGWMLEPTYNLGNRLQVGIRGVAGLAWLSNPFDSVKNPGNQSYSTAVSAWLLVGASLSYPIGNNWRVYIGGNFQHISNGSIRQPNKGVNYPTASLQVHYTPNNLPYYKGTRSKEKYWKGDPWRKDIGIFGIGKRWIGEDGMSDRKPIVGLMVNGSKQVGRINALTLGLEAYYDGYSYERLKADTLAGDGATRIGLMGGHEFLLGKFVFSQQVGAYLYKPSPYDDAWFHRWGLMYNINKHLWAGINLKAHRHVADFIDMRITYSWK